MRVLRGHPSGWDPAPRPTALSVGVFDGVHLGHRHVLSRLTARAAAAGLEPGVVTFDPHPLAVVAPDRVPAILTPLEFRLELFAELEVEVAAVVTFDGELRRWSPATFVDRLLVEVLKAGLVVVGEDFRFGRDRTGHVGLLEELGSSLGFDTEVLPLVGGDRPVSSTVIRQMIAAGEVAAAARALARPHEIWGEVIDLGGEAVRLAVPAGVAAPAPGVYGVRCGRNPDESLPAEAAVAKDAVEVRLLDVEQEIAGPMLRVRFVERIG